MTASNKHAILIVDDEPDVLFSLTGLLRRDFEVHTAESGAQALEILEQHPIHVIMTDQRMPSMTGVELMQRVRSEHPESIRIIFTGYADIRAIVEAINSGGLYRYITKPWDPEDLIDVLKEAALRYDATVAQAKFFEDLKIYLDDVSALAQGTVPSEDNSTFREAFQGRTESLREYLRSVRDSE